MRIWRAALVVGLALVAVAAVAAQGPESLPRVEASDLHYLGSFSLPQRDSTGVENGRLTYGGSALAMAPDGGLYLVGHAQTQPARVFEVGIAKLGGVATIRQDGLDPAHGAARQIDSGNEIKIGGLLVYGGRLVTSYYSYYDADTSATLSHTAGPLDLESDGPVVGPVQVGMSGAGFVGGYMTAVPSDWRDALGGPALTGQCCLAIIGRSSLGPSLSVFDPDDIGRVRPVPATMLVGYTESHPTLGAWRSASTRYNGTTEIGGVAFPAGTRSVLFVGRQGVGTFCYGGLECNDPVGQSQGVHAYPYVHQVWAYDASDLAKVKAGEMEPWQVEPYATWRLPEMNDSGSASIRGAVYDPATQRLYVTESYGERPTVHVYELTVGTSEESGEPPVIDQPVDEPPPVEDPDDQEPPADDLTIRALLETILERLTPQGTETRCEIAREPSTYADGDLQITVRCPAGALAPVKGAPLTVRPPED